MSMQTDEQQAFDGNQPSSFARGCGPYESSIASSASSSQASIFSDDCSIQSSIASSISDDFRQNNDDARDRYYAQAQLQLRPSQDGCKLSSDQAPVDSTLKAACPAPPSYADVTSVPQDQRQHPRRSSLGRSQKPPSLVRQCERKVNFVESLVGKQMSNEV